MRIPAELLIPEFQNQLYRVAWAVLQNAADAQDAVQLTFIQYHQSEKQFKDKEHIRAWLLRTVHYRALDLRRSWWRKNRCDLRAAESLFGIEDARDRGLFEAVSALKQEGRVVLQLYYCENYSTAQIAEIVDLRPDTVRQRLARARSRLKDRLMEDWNDE